MYLSLLKHKISAERQRVMQELAGQAVTDH